MWRGKLGVYYLLQPVWRITKALRIPLESPTMCTEFMVENFQQNVNVGLQIRAYTPGLPTHIMRMRARTQIFSPYTQLFIWGWFLDLIYNLSDLIRPQQAANRNHHGYLLYLPVYDLSHNSYISLLINCCFYHLPSSWKSELVISIVARLLETRGIIVFYNGMVIITNFWHLYIH